MRRVVKDFILPLAVAVALAFVIQAAVAKPYEIPTASMTPTIEGNDRIIANRLIYRFRDIDRGDIIVFDPPPAATRTCGQAGGGDIPYVKRVIGIPGDTVEVRRETVVAGDGPVTARVLVAEDPESLDTVVQVIRLQPGDTRSVTYVNGEEFVVPEAITPVVLRGDPASYGITGQVQGDPAYAFGPVDVPAGNLIVLGDNRPGSCDSHQWREGDTPAPFVPEGNVIGQGEVTYWPLSHLTFLD
ncbi:MAG: signal peptidase I [Thermoleophilia bacterium]